MVYGQRVRARHQRWCDPGGSSIGRITPSGTVSLFAIDEAAFSIVRGPDDALWYTSYSSIGRVTTNGQAQTFNLDSDSNNIGTMTVGPDGGLWFTSACQFGLLPAVSFGGTPCDFGVGRLSTADTDRDAVADRDAHRYGRQPDADRGRTWGLCPGDCDDDLTISISELITAVNIALGIAPVEQCLAADIDQDVQVLINELVAAVDNALGGCH